MKRLAVDFNKLINYLIIALAFVIPLSYHLRDIILILIILLWIFEGNYKEKFNKFKKIDKSLIIYISVFVLLLVSNLWSSSLTGGSFKLHQYHNSIDFWIRFYLFYLFIIPVIVTSFDKKYTLIAIKSFILAMFISEITSYGIIFGLWRTKYGSPSDPTPFLRYHAEYSLFLAIMIFWLFKFFKDEKNRFRKILIAIFLFTATTNLFFNSGRTGQVIFIFLLFYAIYYYYKLSFKSILIFIVGSLLVFGFYYKISSNFHNRIDYGISNLKNALIYHNFKSSWGGRLYCWILAKDMWLKSPIFGIGMGNTKKEMQIVTKKKHPEMYNFTIAELPHLHNQYLQILVEIGIIGEILFIIAMIKFFLVKYKREIKYFAYILLIAYTIANFTEVFFMKPPTFLFFNLFISIFILNKETNENSAYYK